MGEKDEIERESGLSFYLFFLSFFLSHLFFSLSFPHFSRTVKRRGRNRRVGLRLSLTHMCRPLKPYRSITFFPPEPLFFFFFLSPRSDSSLSLSLLSYILLANSFPHLSLSFFLSISLSPSFHTSRSLPHTAHTSLSLPLTYLSLSLSLLSLSLSHLSLSLSLPKMVVGTHKMYLGPCLGHNL